MTGPQHYEEAERLLAQHAAPQGGYLRGDEPDPIRDPLAAAQVHATLALAAATAYAAVKDYEGDETSAARHWARTV